MINGFLETLPISSTVWCGWSWSRDNTLHIKIFASHHQMK